MADTTIQRKLESWVRDCWSPDMFGQKFQRLKCMVTSGGPFEFDCVSEDCKIVGLLSTSNYKTASGNPGPGNVKKILADVSWLKQVSAERRFLLLTELDMVAYVQKQQEKGRIDRSVEILHIKLPNDLEARLQESKKQAAIEVSPLKSE